MEEVPADPDDEPPWAMQLVARVERTDPPTRTAVCEAAAIAVVRLLTDERSQPDGEWAPQLQRWLDGRIRKHCRRARGIAWERVQPLPGVAVEKAGAQVRALVPTSTDDTPPEVAKLPLAGRELDDPDARPVVDQRRDGPVVVSICPAPFLPLGKAAAAAGHAAQLALMRMPPDRLAVWAGLDVDVVVEHPDLARWRRLRRLAQVEVVDAGLTAVPAGTTTALARWA